MKQFGHRLPRERLSMMVIEDRPSMHLELGSEPESVGLVRAALSGLADHLRSLEGEFLADVHTAVSEACNNVVLHAYGGRIGPLIVELAASADSLEVVVRDHGSGIRQATQSDERMGVGLALISALADRAEFLTTTEGGTEVRVGFNRPTGAAELIQPLTTADSRRIPLGGQIVGALCPVVLLAGVLGRIARLLAARTQFSLERFSDVYLVVDAIAAHAQAYASAASISFALTADERSLLIKVGPLRAEDESRRRALSPPVTKLIDELSVQPVNGGEILSVVLRDDGAETRRSAA
jgi:serine/threonine-protein kinase RsbW